MTMKKRGNKEKTEKIPPKCRYLGDRGIGCKHPEMTGNLDMVNRIPPRADCTNCLLTAILIKEGLTVGGYMFKKVIV